MERFFTHLCLFINNLYVGILDLPHFPVFEQMLSEINVKTKYLVCALEIGVGFMSFTIE